MPQTTGPKLPKWPFFAGDVLLLGVAAAFALHGGATVFWQSGLAVFCLIAGALLGVAPFVMEYRAGVRLAENEALTTAVTEIQKLETIASQISSATSHWQTVQEQADKTTAAARQIADRMTGEAKGFTDLMEKLNDREKAALRLEVDKSRRAEAEWVQVLVRMLDHVYALHVGAVRSSQPALIDQVGNFQNACRDVARRVGLTPFVPAEAEPFDGQRHQLLDGVAAPADGATIAETIATGFTFQGRLVRPALVKLRNGS